MSTIKKSTFMKYLTVFVIASGTTVMYSLPYLKSTFYEPMRMALSLDHQGLGNLISIYGLLATILYFPGGFLADMFSAKKLLTFSLVSTGLLGIYFSTFPSYGQLMLIFALWGITTILTFWASSIKVIRMLGDNNEQGKLFGFNEGLSGISGVIVSFIGLYLFDRFNDVTIGFRYVVLLYSGLSIFFGIVAFFLVKEKEVAGVEKTSFRDIASAVKEPKAWLIGGIVFSTYMVFSSLTYLNPYLDLFKLPLKMISTLAIIRTYGIKMGASPLAGIIVDKAGSSLKVLRLGFVGVGITQLVYLLVPRSASFLAVAVANMLILSVLLFGFRGIYFATVAESNIPVYQSGAVIGLASFVGFSPDAFFYTMVGGWIDKGPMGYTYMFILCLACSVLGLICARALQTRNEKSILAT